jgi:hypothetical protein
MDTLNDTLREEDFNNKIKEIRKFQSDGNVPQVLIKMQMLVSEGYDPILVANKVFEKNIKDKK